MGHRIIFLDVDGTLVDYEGRLPDSAARAVRKARKWTPRVYLHRLQPRRGPSFPVANWTGWRDRRQSEGESDECRCARTLRIAL